MTAQAKVRRRQISFRVAPHEADLIDRIVSRAMALAETAGVPRDRVSLKMDVTACHANGTPLDLVKLLAADDFNLAHDVFGIERHIDRDDRSPTGGQLLGFFSPRCSRPEVEAVQP